MSTPDRYPEESRAALALALGVLGLLSLGILAPVAWYLGRRELQAIDAGRRSPRGRDLASIAVVLGRVGTFIALFAVLAAVFLFGFLIFAMAH